MIIDVKVPQLSESVAEATLVTWHKKAGEAVTRDENLIDIETDKVVLELPAPDGGVLVEIVKTDGETVVAGEVIARIDTAAQAGAVAGAVPATRGIPAKTEAVAMAPVTAAGVALPAARKILEEKGMAASSVAGTGRGGRVTKSDALAAQAQAPVVKAAAAADPVTVPVASPVSGLAPAPSVTVPLGDRPEQRVPMSRLRARVAERLLQSQATNAILTTFNEVNMG
ncbi:MAG: E3 binding domain-containing protein, partial [Candidatus Accumulibacter phosphatis]